MIGSVDKRGSSTFVVFDEKGRRISSFTHSGELVNYTSNVITIRVGHQIVTFDEKGRRLGGRSV